VTLRQSKNTIGGPEFHGQKSFPEVITGEYSDPYYKPFYEIDGHLPHAIKQTNVSNHSCSPSGKLF